MSLAATVTAMADAGCSAEQIAAVVVAHEREAETAAEAKRAQKRAANAERQRRSRLARNACHAVTARDSALQGVTARDPSPSPPQRESFPPAPPFKEKLTPSPTPTPLLTSFAGPPSVPGRRACRLPEDWRPNDAGRALAVELLGSGKAAHAELDKFRDHWRAANGANAVKRDWDATWRNWVRRAAERPAARAGPLAGRDCSNPRLQALIDVRRAFQNQERYDDEQPILDLPPS